MSLTAAEVAEILRLVEQSSFDELTLEMNGVKLSLRRGTAPAAGVGSATDTPAAAADAAPASLPAAAQPGAAEPGLTPIESPMLGTFYRAPKPGAAPFVEVGAEVVEETVVAIIEVMKLMNTVRAGVRGTVAHILPDDGALVEHGEILMQIRAGR